MVTSPYRETNFWYDSQKMKIKVVTTHVHMGAEKVKIIELISVY